MFEGPISYNKEKINIAPPPWDALGKKIIFEFL